MTILAVDDEKPALASIVEQLRQLLPEAEVLGFRKPSEALEAVQEKPCEIAFLDIEMKEMDGITLNFDNDALEYMVDKAVEYKLGARGLRSIMEAVMMDAQFESPSWKKKSFTVTKEYAEQQLNKVNLPAAV